MEDAARRDAKARMAARKEAIRLKKAEAAAAAGAEQSDRAAPSGGGRCEAEGEGGREPEPLVAERQQWAGRHKHERKCAQPSLNRGRRGSAGARNE